MVTRYVKPITYTYYVMKMVAVQKSVIWFAHREKDTRIELNFLAHIGVCKQVVGNLN